MPTDIKNSIGDLVSIFTSLRKIKDEPRGVSSHSSVVKDNEDKAEKVKPSLESTEITRFKNIADVLGKVWKLGDYAPKPEAGKLDDLTPDKQRGLGAIKDKIVPIQKQEKENGLMGMLKGLLGALGIAGLWQQFKKALTVIIGKLGAFFKGIGSKLWAAIKWIPQKLLSAMKWAGSKILAGIKWLGGKLFNWAGKLVDKIKSSKFYTGFMEKVATVKNGLKSVWDNIITSIKGFVDDIIGGILKVKDAAFKALEKIPGVKLLKEGAKKVIEKVFKPAAKIVGTAAEGTAKVTGTVVRGAAKLGGTVARGAAKLGGKLTKAIAGKIGSAVGSLFKGGSSSIGKVFRAIPLVAPAIESLFAANDIQKFKSEYDSKAISLDDLRLKAGKRVVEAITALGGAALGGAALSFIPGIGTIAGAVAGDFAGRYLGELLVEKMVSPNLIKKFGAYITGTQELQDFIVKGNKVYPFNNKDELLGMKTGGAIDNLINSKSENIAPVSVVEHNKFAKLALEEQIKRQGTMIELLTQLVRKPSGSTVINNPSRGTNTSPSNFRDSFASQTLVTN